MKVFLSVIIAFFVLSKSVFAQKDEKKEYYEKVKKMGLRMDPDYYYGKHVNLSKIKELKEAGFDIFQFEKHAGDLSYQEAAVVSDIIVTGVIISKEYDTGKDSYFHSVYKVRIEKVVKGSKLRDKEIVTINMKSGMIDEKSYLSNSNEPELYIGDRALFFLNYVPFESAEKAKKEGLLTKSINVNKKDREVSFVLQQKFSSKSGYIFNEDNMKVEELDVALEIVKKLNSINLGDN